MSEPEANSVYSITKTATENGGKEAKPESKTVSEKDGEEPNPQQPPSRTSTRRKTKKTKTKRNLCKDLTVIVGFTLLVFVYVCCGGLFFHLLESPQVNEREHRMLRLKNDTAIILATQLRLVVPHEEIWLRTIYHSLDIYYRDLMEIYGSTSHFRSEKDTWNFKNSAFFSIYLMTATGSFDSSPYTTWGKGVSIVFAALGIPLMIIWIIIVGEGMSSAWLWLFSSKCGFFRIKKIEPKTKKTRKIQSARKKKPEILIVAAILSVVLFIIYFFLGATLIAYNCNELTLVDSMYVLFLTFSTVGTNCFVPTSAKTITFIPKLLKNGYFVGYILIGYLILSFAVCTVYKLIKMRK
ncbi:TWiK family of potassium channels protein 7-like [Centruroides vittatus]|uniref:TWiK family of potassium channels protein 7-like n=1 Tax=Centruroides vittatus TaxID=120091 RepID=UPI00350FCEEB